MCAANEDTRPLSDAVKNESSTLNSEPQGRARLWALPLWVSCVALLAGCGASTDDRLGGEGERPPRQPHACESISELPREVPDEVILG